MLDEHGMVQLDFYPPNAKDDMSYHLNIEVKSISIKSFYIILQVYNTRSFVYICTGAILKSSRVVPFDQSS